MSIENATYISQLDARNPTAMDKLKEGDDHLRLIKTALQNTVPNWDNKITLSAAQLNKIYDWMFTVEDKVDEPEELTRFTVIGDAEFRKDIYLTEGADAALSDPSTPNTPKITGLSDILFTTEEEEDPDTIDDEKNSRALNLRTADKRYLKVTAEGEIAGGINKLTHEETDGSFTTVAQTSDKTLTISDDLVVKGKSKSSDGVNEIDWKEGKAKFKEVVVGKDLRVTGSIFRGSDVRLKTEIQPVSATEVDMLSKLRPVSYRKQGTLEYGLIAQEIPDELGRIVSTTHEHQGVDYVQLIPLLIKKIQDLEAKINGN